jgi:transcriptional regulator with XRE-family HTH domain
MAMSNRQFAEAVGCDITTASRYRNGHRLPGVRLMRRIRDVLGVDQAEIERLWDAGPEAFSAFLREHVFEEKPAA